jgi:hypothetical protein
MKKILQVAVILAWGIQANGQGTFQNLDFEEANPIIIQGSLYNYSLVANALPY